MPTDTHDPLIGETIGDYRIERVLGRGGMGVVYGAEDTALGIPVALKMIAPDFARSDDFVRRFRSEARAMARITSPHIVRVMAMRQTERGLFIVMECVNGGTVHDQMVGGAMSWKDARPMLVQSLLALEHAHAVGIAHRDIKPRNLMLTKDGTVKVADFGLAKMLEADPAATVTKGVAGTLLYMSPEQVRADPNLDERTDLFSLGLTAYEMIAGCLPFDRDAGEYAVMRAIAESEFRPPSHHQPGIPEELDAAIMSALEKTPAKRYPSARAMREAFEAVGADVPARRVKGKKAKKTASEPIKKKSPARAPRAGAARAGAPRGLSIGLVAGAMVLLAAVAAGGWWWWSGEAAPAEPATVRLEAGVPGALVFSGDSLLGVVPGPFVLPAGTIRLRVEAGPQRRDTLLTLAPGSTVALDVPLRVRAAAPTPDEFDPRDETPMPQQPASEPAGGRALAPGAVRPGGAPGRHASGARNARRKIGDRRELFRRGFAP